MMRLGSLRRGGAFNPRPISSRYSGQGAGRVSVCLRSRGYMLVLLIRERQADWIRLRNTVQMVGTVAWLLGWF